MTFNGPAKRFPGGLDLDEIHRSVADNLLNFPPGSPISIARQPLDCKINIRIGRVPGLVRREPNKIRTRFAP